eukprot:ANDGO_06104.mRNA.1 Protein fyv10
MDFERSLFRVPLDHLNRDARHSSKLFDKEVQTLEKALDALLKKQDTNEQTTIASIDKILVRLRDLRSKFSSAVEDENRVVSDISARVSMLKRGFEHSVIHSTFSELSQFCALRGKPRLFYSSGGDGGKSKDSSSGSTGGDGASGSRAASQYQQLQWAELQRADMVRIRVNRLLSDHLLRQGYYETARQLAQDAAITQLVDLDVFASLKHVLEDLRAGDCASALEWCAENRVRLRSIHSRLELELRMQQFIELVRKAQVSAAVAHAKEYFPQFVDVDLHLIQSAMGLLVFAKLMRNAAFSDATAFVGEYQALLSADRWDTLVKLFEEDHCSLLSLSPSSAFNMVLASGICGLKTPKCGDASCDSSRCPICSASFKSVSAQFPCPRFDHSILICRENQSVMDEDNLPIAVMPGGSVYSASAIRESLMDPRTTAVFDRRTGLSTPFAECRKVYIT